MRTGLVHTPIGSTIIDYGDLHVFESDPQRQIAATIAESFRVATTHRRSIFIGGEHMISAATYEGVARAAKIKRGNSVAYLQIDHHFDFGDQSPIHGRYYHGSNARRISELDLMPTGAMGFFGVGDFTSDRQFHSLQEAGYPIVSTLDLMENGNFSQSLHSICDRLLARADELYVSIDIDVCDSAHAPGTGHVTFGGIGARDFLSIAEVIKHYPVAALDLVEVSPDFDPTGATAHLAARFLFEYMCLSRGAKE